MPVGEKKSGLTPAIRFCEDITKKDDDEEEATLATIKVKIDPNGADDRTNLEDKKSPQIKNLTYAGAEVMKSIRALDLDLYRPQGITDGDHAFERISYFERTLSGNARSQFNKIYEQARKKSLDKWTILETDPNQYEELMKDRTKFSEWTLEDEELSEEDKKKTVDEQIVLTEQLVMGHEAAQTFEKLLWFELGKLIWKDHRQMYYDHIKYLQQHICKPFKWTMIQYISRVRELFDYCIYLQPPTMRGQNWEKADWKARNTPAPEKSIREAIKDGLPQAMQDKILEKDDDYRLTSEEDFNDMLTNLELSDERDRATRKIAEEDMKRVRAELREKHDRDKGVSSNKRRKLNTNGRGIARHCSLCKNAGMPERKFMSHSDSQCQDKTEMAKRAMSGSVADQSKQVKKYRKEYKAIHKKLMATRKKHKKLLAFNRKNSSTKEFRKIQRNLAESESDASLNLSDSDDFGSDISMCSISDNSMHEDE